MGLFKKNNTEAKTFCCCGSCTPEAIAQVCGISKQAAEFRSARMRELEHRGRFYAHPLERQLISQFGSYIAAVRR